MKYEQMSIYDFIQDGEVKPINSCVKGLTRIEVKSQEVAPSETLPQVDEAQEVKAPSSALDTRASNTLDKETYETIVEECEEAFKPTENTDKTLFSVGDLITVRKAEDVYPKGVSYEGYGVCTPEDYYHLKEFETQQGLVTFYDGKSYKCKMFKGNKLVGFYPNELK